MPTTTYSLHRVGGETQLGSASAVLDASPLQSGQSATVSRISGSSGQPELEVRLLNANGQAAHTTDIVAGEAGANIVDPEITALSGGGSVLTWLSAYSHGPQAEYAVLNAQGQLVANGTTSGTATGIEAIALANGGFDLATAQSDIYGLHTSLTLEALNASGAVTSAARTVDTSSNTTGTAGYSDLGGVSTGAGVELFWDNGSGVHTAVVANNGSVHEADLATGAASGVAATALDNGYVAVGWASASGSGSQVMTETVNPSAVGNGSALARAIAVATSGLAPGQADPELASVGQGRYAISWRPDATHDASAQVYTSGGVGGPVTAGAGDIAGTGSNGSVYTLSHHGGDVWFDQYVDPPAAQRSASSAHAAVATPVAATPAAAPSWLAAYEAEIAAAIHHHAGAWMG